MTRGLERFKRVESIFEAVIQLPPDSRADYLKKTCLDEPGIREEVESLLDEDERPKIDAPALGLANRFDLPAIIKDHEMPERVGRYRIIRECGQGGMGNVYEAIQDYPERRVALKMIRPGMMSRRLMKRFRYETEFLGRLQHPGVAQIFDAGVTNIGAGEQPFFVMELIDGPPLIEHLQEAEFDTKSRLMLFVMICEAVHHAHQRGVIHRDLKPDNIMVVPAESESGTDTGHYASLVGQPKVLDFGIARATDADVQATIQTDAGALVGTLQYMSPEQASGNSTNLDVRSDIYALGVILFEMLSDKTPYNLIGKNIAESVRVIREQDPSRLSSVDSRFRGDVETIVGKCLEKEPQRRYASASDLAGDVRRHLQDEPISARPPSTWYQLRKFSRRNRQLIYGVIATVIALTLGLVGTVIYALQASENAKRAGQSETIALGEAYRANISAAINLTPIDPITAGNYLDRIPEEQRGWEWHHAQSQIDQYDLTYEAPVAAVGKLLMASGGSRVVSALDDHQIAVWDAESAELLKLLPTMHEITTIAAPRDADRVIGIGTDDGRILTWNLTDDEPREIYRTGTGERIRNLAWSRDGRWLAATVYTQIQIKTSWIFQNASLVMFRNGSLHHKIKLGNNKRILGLDFNHDGSKLAVVVVTGNYVPGVLSIIDLETFSIERNLQIADHPETITYSADGQHIYAGTDQRTVVPVESTSLKQLGRMTGHLGRVVDVEFQPNGELVASSSLDKTIRLWNTRTGEAVAVVNAEQTQGHANIVFNKEGTRLLYNVDGKVYSWDLNSDSLMVLKGHDTYVYFAAWSDDGSMLASAARNAPDACMWDPNSGKLIRNYEFPVSCYGLQFTDNGKGLCSGSAIIQTATGRTVAHPAEIVYNRHYDQFSSVDDSGRRQATGRYAVDEPTAIVYEIADRATGSAWKRDPHSEIARFEGPYNAVSLSHDGKLLAATHLHEPNIDVWNVDQKLKLATLTGHTSYVYTLDFSPDDSRLASGSNDNTVRIWDVQTWQQVADLRGHEQYVMQVAFSPDGTRLASASGDHTVRIWDTLSRYERAKQARDLAKQMERMRPRVESLAEELGDPGKASDWLIHEFPNKQDYAAALRVLIDFNMQSDNTDSPLPTKLVPQALWEFPDDTAVLDDRYYHLNHAAKFGDARWKKDDDPARGGTVEFDGNDDYLEAADSPSLSLTGDLTIAAWVHVTNFEHPRTIVAKTKQGRAAPYEFFLSNDSGIPILQLGNGTEIASATAAAAPDAGRWAHVAVTRSGNVVTHYLNGMPNGRETIYITAEDKDGTMKIGSRDDLYANMLGRLDNVVIYNSALTPEQIRAIVEDRDKEYDGLPDEIGD